MPSNLAHQIATATDTDWLSALHDQAWRDQDIETRIRCLNRLKELRPVPVETKPRPCAGRRRYGNSYVYGPW